LKYIGYIRVSRDREGGISADQQRVEIEHWAAAPDTGREIIWLPPDADWSGKSLQRPSIQKALKLLRAGQVDGLVVSKLDRLTRSVADLNGLIKEAQVEGWNLVGLDIGVDLRSTNGKMVAQLIGTISEWYLDRVTEEWEKVRRYKIEAKGAHWGAPPLGYARGRTTNDRGQPTPGALIVEERWAPLVEEVFSRRAARKSDGTWAKLAQYLTAEGAPNYLARAQAEKESRPVAGTRWSAGGVKSIIANRAYLGEARSGNLVKSDAHPALVDKKTWQAANRKGPTYGTLADRKDGPLLGGGLLRCGTCSGGLVRSTSRSKRGRRYVYYRCPAPTCKPRATIMARRIEEYLIDKAFERLDDVQCALHTSLPEIRRALFVEDNDREGLDLRSGRRETRPARCSPGT
jgi:DNA invertase Pin-like site-specific DNA recombinase